MNSFRLIILLQVTCSLALHAAVTQDFVVDLKATISDTAPHIVLSWTQRVQANITAQKVHRRLKGETTWVKLADLTTTNTSYTDTTALPGIEYEYRMERNFTGLSPNVAMGYISAGVKVPEVHDRGTLLLVIDDTMTAPLAPEIDQLKADLAADGWTVQEIVAPRSGTAISTKALITAAYNSDPTQVKQVYVLGHVPVPHSGNSAPDGHSNHGGAWSADGYYGEMNGTWTDTTVNTTTPARAENDNIPGDGKFDQTQFPSLVELGVGRVDLYRMGRAPSPISATPEVEISLLRRYLNKAHDFRHKLGAYAAIPRRTLIRDGFGHAFSSEPFAVTAWAGAYSFVGHPPASPIDAAPSWQWFSPTYAGGQDYLWGHGCGGGSYESASNLGNSTDFGHKTSRVVFTTIFGSYHGDWDSDSNLMRSVLAGNPDGDSLGLCCFWQGRPNFFVHHLGMGETLGFMVRESMNAGVTGGGGYLPGGSSFRGTHIGLLGDPALRVHAVEPPRRLAARSLSGQVELSWAASTEPGLQGYHVYRAATAAGPFSKLTTTPLAVTAFTDSSVTAGNPYTYLVRTMKLESVPGGSYHNLSVGSSVSVTASSAASSPPLNPSELAVVSQTSAVNAQIAWQDNAADETGYRIERKVNAAGSWATLATLAANTTSHTDTGPFTHLNTYFYRVIATNAAGDSIPSNVDSFEASAGFVEMTERILTVNKNAGSVTISAKRFGGATGAVTVNCATSNSAATAGTHYTSTNLNLSWADGETGSKNFIVPITNTPTPQQARQFLVTLSSPTSGARLGVFTRSYVLIEDPTATLNSAWTQTFLGSAPSYPYGTTSHTSAATDAEGFIGSTMIGGSLASAGTTDTGRFVYQQRTGDGSMTAYIRTSNPANSSARMALMIRAAATNNAKMAGVVASSSTGTSGYGTTLVYRSGTTLVDEPATTNQLVTPCWIRLSRLGDTFVAEHSANGTVWTTVSQATVAGIPATAYWGLFNVAGGVAVSSDYSANFQLSGFENISFGGVSAPETPDGVAITAVTNSSISLTWNTKTYASSYLIQRRAEGEDFSTFATVTAVAAATQAYSNTPLAGDTPYQYRIISTNSVGDSPPSAIVSAVTSAADVEILRTAEADATVRADTPAGNFGSDSIVTVSGPHPVTSDLSASAKSYLRFNLAGLPGTIKTAQLRLVHVANRLLPPATYYYMTPMLLTTDTADVWDESTITWDSAPLNNTTGTGLLSPNLNLGFHYLETFPATGEQSSVTLNAVNLQANTGANNLVTIVALEQNAAAQADWASAEHGAYAAPTLSLTFNNPLPKRPGFLTVSPGAGSSMNLTWLDDAADETGFQIERRAANGAWTLIATLDPDTTGFTDTTAMPGVIYEYRIRSNSAAGDSNWATAASLQRTSVATIGIPVWSADSVTFNQADAPPGNGYVPTGFTYRLPTDTTPPLDFVTGQTLTSLRSNFSGWLGMKITTGDAPVIVRELGRWVVSGSTDAHTVKIVNATTSADVPGASVSIATDGAPDGFAYAALPAPVTLGANSAYFIVSQEVNGGDLWYEGNTTLTYAAAVATVNNAINSSNGATYNNSFSADKSYVPVTFKYSAAATPFINGHGLTTLRNDFTGWLGMEITTGSSSINVGELGRWVVAGNTGTHTVKLIEAASGATLGSVNVATAGATAGQFKYSALPGALTLSPSTRYYVLSQETSGGDQWYGFGTVATGTATGYQNWLLANGLPMDESGQGSATATPASDGLPNLIKYALGLAPAANGNGGRLGYGTTTDTGSDYLTFIYTRPEPAPAGITCTVEASPGLNPLTWTTAGLVEISSVVNGATRTITIRDSTAISGGIKRFMRLKVTQL